MKTTNDNLAAHDDLDLTSYDVILLNTSAGKDSQAMMHHVVEAARDLGIADRLVAVHADLGRVEWKGTRELAERQAKAYGLRFEVVSRPQGDLLEQVEKRGMWPSSTARYCTSDHKRGQIAKVITMLVKEAREANGGRRVRVLNCLGFRSEESPARAKRQVFTNDARLTNGKRVVDVWLPIQHFVEAEVWATIKASGVESHEAYAKGMPRLSCVFCVFAPKSALLIAGEHNPDLLDTYCDVEKRIDHDFKNGMKIAEIREALARGERGTVGENWQA